MACNCKRINKFQKENGVPVEESLLTKAIRYGMKVFFFIVTIVLGMIIVPYIIIYSLYALFFGDNKITLPLFLRKYMVA